MKLRIVLEWRDWDADYCWVLEESDGGLRSKWVLKTAATFDREKAKRWALHYQIPLPERPTDRKSLRRWLAEHCEEKVRKAGNLITLVCVIFLVTVAFSNRR
jgi:hypothetical protein